MPRHPHRATLLALSAAAVPLSLPLTPARAADLTWSSPTSGRWLDPIHWSTGTAPTYGDFVTIDSPGSYTVTLDGSANVGSVTLNAPDATLSVLNSANYFYTGPFAISAGTLSVQSRLNSIIHINPLSFSNAGTITFDAD